MRVRNDLDGVIFAHVRGGSVMLKAGDEVPAGAVIADALCEPEPKLRTRRKTAARKAVSADGDA
ncbi:hypothetical protein TH728_03005 [Corynebacterium amycolatum]|uniref:hypothetical protein n=1 Tax=Corynebacterium amycolatum TaxID=43765 RepID=UPI002AAEF934|nr:hypothetical protein [Corynebacterium amycolatum]MDY7341396.1 hypothetical protein [Corynebacterium amycolatum]